ncbi:MAG: hypothetical protein CM1200mP40_31970 [Gammaproteobacteria bacterium]|nr:MAG: hypothetical protein CM1200mP40_31970 [Gammaproteobacteria bacterium]
MTALILLSKRAKKERRSSGLGFGGWGKRRTLFGGNHTAGRDDSLSDPTKEPARIRAMYTHPGKGPGKVLGHCCWISVKMPREMRDLKQLNWGQLFQDTPLFGAWFY